MLDLFLKEEILRNITKNHETYNVNCEEIFLHHQFTTDTFNMAWQSGSSDNFNNIVLSPSYTVGGNVD
jgi:hypothetical protein